MRRPSRSPRIVTLCVRGNPARDPDMNVQRLALLRTAVLQLAERPDWAPVDALLLPAGYFRIGTYVGALSSGRRRLVLAREAFAHSVMVLCEKLERQHPGILIISGIDSMNPSRAVRGRPALRRL
jgi:hypothetical protein